MALLRYFFDQQYYTDEFTRALLHQVVDKSEVSY